MLFQNSLSEGTEVLNISWIGVKKPKIKRIFTAQLASYNICSQNGIASYTNSSIQEAYDRIAGQMANCLAEYRIIMISIHRSDYVYTIIVT